jgi:peptidoglycan hydrolase CwlO-like protein
MFFKKALKISFATLLIGFLIFFARSVPKSHAQSTDEQQLQEQIDKYEKEIERLKGQALTLTNQIAQYDAQIKLTSLQISETETKISQLAGRIDQLEVSLDALTQAFSSRATETYKMARLEDPILFIVSAPDLSVAMSRFHYLKKIQSSDRDLMLRLQSVQTTYKGEKQDQEQLQAQLEVQKKNLDAQKYAKANLLQVTHNDEKRFQQLLSEAKAQLAALRRFVISQGGASILHNQTKCDSWGCYYNQRDGEWGNMGLGGSSYSVAEYGCLVTSVSMIASHNGKNIKPSDIALNSGAFVPGTGYLLHSFSANGINVSIDNASKDKLDSELAAGRPVIAGLYSGPDHFIVILRKDGDNYVMNDPFLENGSQRPLNDKYSASDITSLRLVQFN